MHLTHTTLKIAVVDLCRSGVLSQGSFACCFLCKGLLKQFFSHKGVSMRFFHLNTANLKLVTHIGTKNLKVGVSSNYPWVVILC